MGTWRISIISTCSSIISFLSEAAMPAFYWFSPEEITDHPSDNFRPIRIDTSSDFQADAILFALKKKGF